MTNYALYIDAASISSQASVSTLTGCQLFAHSEDAPMYKFTVNSDKSATLKCQILVQATGAGTDDTLQSRLDALLAVLTNVVGKAIKLEYAPAKTRFTLPTNNWPSFRCEAVVTAHARGALVDCTFTAAAVAGAALNTATTPHWTIDGTSSGLFIATALVFFASKTLAEAYVTALKAGTEPAWMGSKFRYFDHSMRESDDAGGSLGDFGVELTVQMRQWPDEFLAMAVLANAVFVDYKLSIKSRGAVSRVSGQVPAKNVLISGAIIWKVHQLTALIGGDSAIAKAAIEQYTNAAIDSLIADAQLRTRFTFRELDREVNAGVRDGEQTFAVVGIKTDGDNPVLDWDESVTLHFTGGRRYGSDYEGLTRRFDHPAGMDMKLTHKIDAQCFTPFPYYPPIIGGSGEWDPEEGELPRAEPDLYDSGELIYRMKSQVTWRRVITAKGQVKQPFTMADSPDFESLIQ